MSLANFKSAKPKRTNNTLEDGRHDVNIIRVVHLSSDRMKDFNGTMKTKEELEKRGVDWTDTQEQLGVVYQNENGKTVIHRYNTVGFVRYDELPSTKGFIKSASDEGYALNAKTLKRVVSKERTDQCENILNELMFNCETKEGDDWVRIPEGSPLSKLLNARVNVKVTHKKYRGEDVPPEVGSYRPYGYKAKTEDEQGIEEPVPQDIGEGFE